MAIRKSLMEKQSAGRQVAATKLSPIVIVTGSNRDLDHLAVACVLRKPVDPDMLVETVRKCLKPPSQTG